MYLTRNCGYLTERCIPMRRILFTFVLLPVLLALLAPGPAVNADLSAQESPLNPSGKAFELHPDSQGRMWVTDYNAGEILRFDPSGQKTAYSIRSALDSYPSDATPDSSGAVWWVDGSYLGRLNPSTAQIKYWYILGSSWLYGLAFDATGRVWMTDSSTGGIFMFDMSASYMCSYPTGSRANYPVMSGKYLWSGDISNNNSRLVRLDTEQNRVDWWQLAAYSTPKQVTVSSSSIWYSDYYYGELGRLEPSLSRLTTYPLGYSQYPNMLSASGGKLWFTAQGNGLSTIGMLDPTNATGYSRTVNSGSFPVDPSCQYLDPPYEYVVETSSTSASWPSVTYPTLTNANGLIFFQLPNLSEPWGINAGSDVWYVDSGRQQLARLNVAAMVTVTACKKFDQDKNLNTTSDQISISGWEMILSIDGSDFGSKLTGSDGCAAWYLLSPGSSYAVREVTRANWQALGDTSRDFGNLSAGASRQVTFFNWIQLEHKTYIPQVTR